MADDELSAPLGQNAKKERKKGRRFKLPICIPHIIAGLLGLFVGACAVWALMVYDPLGGEPMAVIAAGFDPPKPTVDAGGGFGRRSHCAQGPRSYDGPGNPAAKQIAVPPPVEAAPTPPPANGNTVTIIDGTNGKRQDVLIPGRARRPRAARAAAARRLHATAGSRRIAADGTRPSEALRAPPRAFQERPNAPRIAIVVGGLGISAVGTSDALAKLPGAGDLRFAPYGADVERLAARARDGGHELLLQVPMEPFDYPDNDPGPQTLLTSLNPEQNLDRLHWLMSRLQGYVGIANYMGGRFTATEQALAPVLREAAKRGLIYRGGRQLAAQPRRPDRRRQQSAFRQGRSHHRRGADLGRDRPCAARLEKTARERGFAVGMAMRCRPRSSASRIWAKAAESRGILLVPISAVAIRGKSS